MDSIPATADLLHLLRDWDQYRPDMKGYISPSADVKLPLPKISFEMNILKIRDYLQADEAMLSHSAPFTEALPALRIPGTDAPLGLWLNEQAICSTGLELPQNLPRFVPADKLAIRNPRWHSKLLVASRPILQKMHADNNGDFEITLAGLTVMGPSGASPTGQLSLPSSGYAVLHVLLPSSAEGAEFVLCHAGSTLRSSFPADDLQCGSYVIGAYTGVDSAQFTCTSGILSCLTYAVTTTPPRRRFANRPMGIEYISGASPGLRDTFCAWRYAIENSATKVKRIMFITLDEDIDITVQPMVSSLQDRDRDFLMHLAPLAKAYGFRFYFCTAIHTESGTYEVAHPYKEYYEGDGLDLEDVELEDADDSGYEWEVYELSGLRVSGPARKGLQAAVKKAAKRGDLDSIREREPKKTHSDTECGLYSDIHFIDFSKSRNFSLVH
ncbi:hypothetical protein HGRIS_003359 [Hohenbuehelia grisea]|uniref:Uncharacterized protein n=1 Tax=Hohenbuehelia grisea TaxID=104357 RepID=A0ABR3JGU5_9AGAR